MYSLRRDIQGRYRSEYSELQQRAQGLAPDHVQAVIQHTHPAVISPASTAYPSYLGGTEVNNVRVSCTILGGEGCQCGKFKDMHACILKFHTSLEQRRECRINRVTVKVCFKENGPNNDSANRDLQLLERPFPQTTICGEQRQEHVVRKGNLTPNIQFPGGGGGLGGYERTYETDYVRCWQYNSQMYPDEHGVLSVVHWNWHADPTDPEVQHTGPLYSGVVLGHPDQAFWLGCKIELKLCLSYFKYLKRLMGHSRQGYKFKQIQVSQTDTNLDATVTGLDDEIFRLMSPRTKQEETAVTD